jgi:hypothetical protein
VNLLCDACWKASLPDGCGEEPVRAGDPCESFEPTLESVFGPGKVAELLDERGPIGVAEALIDFCQSNGYPEDETRKTLQTLALLPQDPREALDEGARHARRLLLEVYRSFLKEKDRSPLNFAKVLFALWLSTVAGYTRKGTEIEMIRRTLTLAGKWLVESYSERGRIRRPTIRIIVEDAPRRKRH